MLHNIPASVKHNRTKSLNQNFGQYLLFVIRICDMQIIILQVKIWFQNRRARERRERPQPSMVTSDPGSTSPIRVLPENIPSTSFISYSPDSSIGPARTSPQLISHVDFNIHSGSMLLSNLQVVYNKDNNRQQVYISFYICVPEDS